MTYDGVQEFHRDLLEIAKLGIPLDLGFDRMAPSVQRHLEHGSHTRSSTALKRSSIETITHSTEAAPTTQLSNQHQELSNFLDATASSIQQSLQDKPLNSETVSAIPGLPPKYRSALAMWLATEGSPIAFDLLVTPGLIRKQTRKLWNVSLLHPLMVFAISYFVMIYLCSATIPKLESIYEQTGHAPGFASSIMFALRKLRIIWIPIVPLFIACWIYIRARRSQMSPAKNTVGSKESTLAMAAVTAEQLAVLLRQGIAMPNALEIVQLNPARLPARENEPDLESLASAPSRSVQFEHERGSWRPMMQHAISLSSVNEKVIALQSAAATYRSLANMRHARVRNWVPRLAMGLLGGMLVLGVGLSVFWPIAELLYDLAKPGGNR